jgi:hypothetical protein
MPMAHVVDELARTAEAAIEAMKDAARAARHAHARSELMRHMLSTARKVKDRPMDEAVEIVVGEWMAAWNLDRTAWPGLARDMMTFTAAFHHYANTPTDAADEDLRRATKALEDAFASVGTTLSDQMAWRSQCAHGWWQSVVATPEDLPGLSERPAIPISKPTEPFWSAGCPASCR